MSHLHPTFNYNLGPQKEKKKNHHVPHEIITAGPIKLPKTKSTC